MAARAGPGCCGKQRISQQAIYRPCNYQPLCTKFSDVGRGERGGGADSRRNVTIKHDDEMNAGRRREARNIPGKGNEGRVEVVWNELVSTNKHSFNPDVVVYIHLQWACQLLLTSNRKY